MYILSLAIGVAYTCGWKLACDNRTVLPFCSATPKLNSISFKLMNFLRFGNQICVKSSSSTSISHNFPCQFGMGISGMSMFAGSFNVIGMFETRRFSIILFFIGGFWSGALAPSRVLASLVGFVEDSALFSATSLKLSSAESISAESASAVLFDSLGINWNIIDDEFEFSSPNCIWFCCSLHFRSVRLVNKSNNVAFLRDINGCESRVGRSSTPPSR